MGNNKELISMKRRMETRDEISKKIVNCKPKYNHIKNHIKCKYIDETFQPNDRNCKI